MQQHSTLRTVLPHALLLLFFCLWPGIGVCGATDASASPLSANHYLISGFSGHLLAYGRLVYEDLEEAAGAAQAHHTLELRLDLADANGHLLQLATPPSLAGLRDQMVAIRQALEGRDGIQPDAAWARLIELIKRLPMHRADYVARTRLLLTAQRGRTFTAQGDTPGARNELSKLINEIEITPHVFPITAVRKSVGAAVAAASALSPHWNQAHKAIELALRQTRWITLPEADHMIHAFDALVAAYVHLPESRPLARSSLKHAAWWLSLDRHNAAFAQSVRLAARSPSLDLQQVGRLQTRLASTVRHERLEITRQP